MSSPSCLRTNESSEATCGNNVLIGEGTFKLCFKETYKNGRLKGLPCVYKILKTGPVFQFEYFKNDIKVIEDSTKLVDKFNSGRFCDFRFVVNDVEVWGVKYSQEKRIVERYISEFEKFNSNSGWMSNLSSRSILTRTLAFNNKLQYHCGREPNGCNPTAKLRWTQNCMSFRGELVAHNSNLK